MSVFYICIVFIDFETAARFSRDGNYVNLINTLNKIKSNLFFICCFWMHFLTTDRLGGAAD